MLMFSQMEVFQTVSSLQAVLTNLSGSVGFVPTMGSLHQGHLSLIEKALEENTHLAISIFVNPTQFDDPTDLEKYPRSLEKDLSMIATIAPKALVFTPAVSEIYCNKLTAGFYSFNGLDKEWKETLVKGIFKESLQWLNDSFQLSIQTVHTLERKITNNWQLFVI